MDRFFFYERWNIEVEDYTEWWYLAFFFLIRKKWNVSELDDEIKIGRSKIEL